MPALSCLTGALLLALMMAFFNNQVTIVWSVWLVLSFVQTREITRIFEETVMTSGQSGQHSMFLTLLWRCSASLTAHREHRVTQETPALWTCTGPGLGGAEQFLRERRKQWTVCDTQERLPRQQMQMLHRAADLLRRGKVQKHVRNLMGASSIPKVRRMKNPQQQHRAFPSQRERGTPGQQCHTPPATGTTHQNLPPGWNPQPLDPGAVGVWHNGKQEGVGAW